MAKRFKNKKSCGFMMVEVLIASAIITVFILAAMAVAQKAISLSSQSLHTAEASFLLEEGAETVRIFRDNNVWATFTPTIFNTTSTYCLSGSASISSWTSSLPTTSPCTKINNFFTRTINISNVGRDVSSNILSSVCTSSCDAGTKLVTITVSWVEGGRTLTRTLSFYIMNIF